MIFQCFNVSDTDESVMETIEILTLELKSDNVDLFNTKWYENHHHEEAASRRHP